MRYTEHKRSLQMRKIMGSEQLSNVPQTTEASEGQSPCPWDPAVPKLPSSSLCDRLHSSRGQWLLLTLYSSHRWPPLDTPVTSLPRPQELTLPPFRQHRPCPCHLLPCCDSATLHLRPAWLVNKGFEQGSQTLMMSDFTVPRYAALQQGMAATGRPDSFLFWWFKTNIAKPNLPQNRESAETPVTALWVHLNELSSHQLLRLSPGSF